MSTPTPPVPPAPVAPGAPPTPAVNPVPPTPPAPPVPAPPAPAPAAPAAPAPAPPAGDPQDVASLPPWAQKIISDTRAEAAGHRTRATAAEQQNTTVLQQVAQALGLAQTPPDPATLQSSLAAAQDQTRQAQLRAALYETASQHGANPAALRDSVSFLESVKALDPSDTAAVVAAAKAAVAANAALAAAPATPAGPPAGGADLSGGNPNAPRQMTEDDLKTMTPEQIVKAQEDGLLRNLLGG